MNCSCHQGIADPFSCGISSFTLSVDKCRKMEKYRGVIVRPLPPLKKAATLSLKYGWNTFGCDGGYGCNGDPQTMQEYVAFWE